METETIRVLVVDDHTVVRKGLVSLLSTPRLNIDVVGEAANGKEAVEMAARLNPDVILLDLVMPRMEGQEATLEIKRQSPHTRILVLTSFGEDERIVAAMQAGAEGYLLKDCSPDELTHTIRSVYMGNVSLPAEMARKIFLAKGREEKSKESMLTPREQEVLEYLAKGLSNQDIAVLMKISPLTVRSHVRNLLKKLGMSNRTQAALYAVDKGLVA